MSTRLFQRDIRQLTVLLTHRYVRFLCASLSGICLILIFPDAHLSSLAWVAFVPLILAASRTSVLERWLLGFVTGAIALFGIHFWLFEIQDFGLIQFVVLELIYSSFYAFWAVGLTLLTRGRFSVFFLAFFWVILEYIRAHMGFLANPFVMLAHSQSENIPLLQIASVTGEHGISFLLVLFNLALAKWILEPNSQTNILFVVLMVVVVHLWGWSVIQREPVDRSSINIAVIQPCLSSKEVRQPGSDEFRLRRLETLTLSVINQDPDLIVWPESALKNLHSNKPLFDQLKSFAYILNKPIITGVSVFNYRKKGSQPQIKHDYNGAYFISPDQRDWPPYFKNILLPFGEYLPLAQTVRWPGWLILDNFNLSPGTKVERYPLDGRTSFSVLICWENLFSSFVRRLAHGDIGFLVHIINDFWFGNHSVSRQHNLASVLRAAENGLPIVVASNTGPSMIIDANGRVVSRRSSMFEKEVIVAKIRPFKKGTLYNRFGDWFVGFSALVLASFACISKFQPHRNFLRTFFRFSGTQNKEGIVRAPQSYRRKKK